MQAQTARRLQEFRFNRYIIGAIAVVGLSVASIFAIQVLTGGETAIESQELSPVKLVQDDPPLPAGWVDSYFSGGAADSYVEQDPPLPAGWVDPYFDGTMTSVRMVEEARFFEQNSWDYRPAASDYSAAEYQFTKVNSHDYTSSVTAQQARFLEENGWDWAARAQIAGGAATAVSAQDYQFIEQNSWDTDRLTLPKGTGSRDS